MVAALFVLECLAGAALWALPDDDPKMIAGAIWFASMGLTLVAIFVTAFLSSSKRQ
jgi:hypothetical protein